MAIRPYCVLGVEQTRSVPNDSLVLADDAEGAMAEDAQATINGVFAIEEGEHRRASVGEFIHGDGEAHVLAREF